MKGPGYGFAELGINCVEIFLRLHLLVFYTEHVGMNSALAGLALGLAIFWDAIIDPIVGYYSDRVRMRRGERYSFLPWGFLLLSFSVLGILHPPVLKNAWSQFFFLLLFSLLVNTAYTALSVPYSALVGDLSQDERERARLIGWRLAFANLGAIFGIAVPSYFIIAKEADPYAQTAWVIVGLLAIGTSISWLTARTYNKPVTQTVAHAKFSLVSHLKNKHFMPLAAAYFVANMGLTFNSSLALYYYRQRLRLSEEEIRTVLLSFLVVFTLSIPLWLFLVRFVAKRKALMGGVFILGISASLIYPLLPSQRLLWTLIFASGVIGALVGSAVLLESLLTDIVKEEEVRTGRDELGLYFGIWRMIGKISRGLALAVTGQILAWARVEDGESSFVRLSFAIGPLTGCFFIGSVLILWRLSIHRTPLN
ncbi:MFS transporter [Bdellovibrio bacteriovorus]|uniref:MFS transporter n=1 Tax=Bdellovibrio bacteriovorus TaxID=959 RepID=UPI0035A633FC